MWFELIKRYWQVSLFKETPANTPYSPLLLCITLFFFFLLILFQWHFVETDTGDVLMALVWSAGMLMFSYGFYTLLLLFLCGKATRFIQTLTCLFACHIIVHVCAFPLLFVIPWLSDSRLIEPVKLLVSLLYLFLTLSLTLWQFMITAYIYKHALVKGYLRAIFAGLGLLACNILVVSFWR